VGLFAAFCLTAQAAEVVGPTDVKQGRPACFMMQGLPKEHLESFNWGVFPKPDDALILDLMDRSQNPVYVFWTETAGKYVLFADVNVPGEYELLLHEFSVGESPIPPPPPPPPIQNMTVLVVEDSSQHNSQMATVLISALWRDWLRANEHEFRIVDKIHAAADVVTWIERAGDDLPHVFFLDGSRIAYEGGLPGSAEEFLTLIRDYGIEE